MKRTRMIIVLILAVIMQLNGLAQRGKGHPHHHPNRHPKKVVVVKRSPYRPKRVVVYHPVWHPKYACNRRWVFFPRYNMYWDNWRNHYVFWNGAVWVSQPQAPPVVVNVNLAEEKHYELKEDEDDNDEIGSSNESHKTEYKPD